MRSYLADLDNARPYKGSEKGPLEKLREACFVQALYLKEQGYTVVHHKDTWLCSTHLYGGSFLYWIEEVRSE